MSTLEARDLACSRGFAKLFRDVSFRLDGGEWIAVRGANGSGKTTLLRCIAGLTRPDSGSVLWNGRQTRDATRPFHAELAYAGHLAGVKDELNAEENLHSALALRGVAASAAAVRAALADAGLDKRRLVPARRLSAGQRRRIGLARLALDPAKLWALDEPLTALDDEGRGFFARLLERHLESGGQALIATHHDLPLAATRELRMGS